MTRSQEFSNMKRNPQARRGRRVLRRTAQALGSGSAVVASVDARVTLAVLWALGRLALKLGPA